MTDAPAHARLSASGASIWLNCTMSPALSAGLERKSSKWADEGTRAHAVAEKMLLKQPIKADEEDMARWVQPYVDYVNDLRIKSDYFAIEARVSLSDLWDGAEPPETLFGTSDFFAVVDGCLHIVDLKYGAGVAVDAINSDQLRYYGLGVVLSLPEGYPIPERVRLTIVQPRAVHPDGTIRHWEIPTVDLLDWGHSVVKPTVELIAADERAKLSVVEGKHCRWCPAAQGPCPVKHRSKVEQARRDFGDL